MATSRANWRAPEERSAAGSGRLDSKLGRGDCYRTIPYRGEKRPYGDDRASMASKFSRTSYASRATIKNFGRSGITSDVAGISKQDCFEAGTIIIADHYEEAYNSGGTALNDRSIIRVPDGKDICRKPRRFIVLSSSYAQHYWALPIYSHNGNGTKYKPRPEEFVTIRDHRASVEAPAQSLHEPLLTMIMSGAELTAPSVAHLAYPVPRSFNAAIKVIGRLNPSSTDRMVKMFNKFCPTGYSPAYPGSGNIVSIHAGMSVYDALKSLKLQRFTLVLQGLSWDKAARLTEKDLEKKGITIPTVRTILCSIFRKVELASRAGPDWNVKIDSQSLAVV